MTKLFECDRCKQIFGDKKGFVKFCSTCGVVTDNLSFSHLFKCQVKDVCKVCSNDFKELEKRLKDECCGVRRDLFNAKKDSKKQFSIERN